MIDQFVTELKSSLSEPRLERYRRPADASDLDMLVNYFWNMALADALHCSLTVAEILLRNAIHRTLSAYVGREDWYDRDDLLEANQREDRDTAKHHIATRGRHITPARVVSHLTFGFWVTLLSRPYNERFWRPDLSDPPNLKVAFPYGPMKASPGLIQPCPPRFRSLTVSPKFTPRAAEQLSPTSGMPSGYSPFQPSCREANSFTRRRSISRLTATAPGRSWAGPRPHCVTSPNRMGHASPRNQ